MKQFIITVMAILTVSIAFHQTPVTTDARKLTKKNGHEHFNVGSTNYMDPTFPQHTINVFKEDFIEATRLKNRFTNDFAPTDPGNSPGIGHPKRVVNVQGFKSDIKEARRLEKTDDQDHFKTGFNE